MKRNEIILICIIVLVINIAVATIFSFLKKEKISTKEIVTKEEVKGFNADEKLTLEDEVQNVSTNPGSVNSNFFATPETLLQGIKKALKESDRENLEKLVKDKLLSEKLEKFLAKGSDEFKIREVGELSREGTVRWSLEKTNGNKSEIFIDLKKTENGWEVIGILQADQTSSSQDVLQIADAFVTATLSQKFNKSLQLVDRNKVSEARLASLCILFEEGEYWLRKQKPIRVIFSRPEVAAFLVSVENKTSKGQFGVTLSRSQEAGWRVTEINLDKLLSTYAESVGGGDIHYSPLVKNLTGGETLALYFAFDEDHLSLRTQKQLLIVARLLAVDEKRQITISGHTDDVGSNDYNDQLSAGRADAVRKFLEANGVEKNQIETQAKGSSQPRRPNVTADGEDNPDGRRANRRSEIYLDF